MMKRVSMEDVEEMMALTSWETTHLHPLLESMHLGDPIVSVGSGNGLNEGMTQLRFKKETGAEPPQLYAVDPCPNEYDPVEPDVWEKISVNPVASTLEELLQREGMRELLVGKCTLWLLWPHPGYEYDAAAIKLLQPRHLVLHVDLLGSGGSPAMNDWLERTCNVRMHLKHPRAYFWRHVNPIIYPLTAQPYYPRLVINRAHVLPYNDIGGSLFPSYLQTNFPRVASAMLMQRADTVDFDTDDCTMRYAETFPPDFPLEFVQVISRNCANCGQEASTRCSRCHSVRSCIKCWPETWKRHKAYCVSIPVGGGAGEKGNG